MRGNQYGEKTKLMKSEQNKAQNALTMEACGAEKLGRVKVESAPAHGEISEHRIIKARKFFARKNETRRAIGNCSRCGKRNENGHRNCDACRKWMADYRQRKKVSPVTVDENKLNQMERRIGFLEIQIANMQLASKVQYKRGFAAAMRARLRTVEMPQSRASYEDLRGTDAER